MDITIQPGLLRGQITAIPSKSFAHRYLICAAFAKEGVFLRCPETNEDIEATAQCLRQLGANILRTDAGYEISPITNLPKSAFLPCRESGATLRFLLPIVGALGVDATFLLEGRLPERPLSPLWEEMERMGCTLSRPTKNTLHCCGKLLPGQYRIPGNISSQFISGLLLALPLLDGPSDLQILGEIQSKPYVDMTKAAIKLLRHHTPAEISVEGDWSNAAFWLVANALGSDIHISGLNEHSLQGDRMITDLLQQFSKNISISAAHIPDLIPILAVVAAVNQGAVFTNIQRLRLKESDRVDSTIAMIRSLGGKAECTENTMTIYGTGLTGGTVESFHDHRIAMSAAIAATVCEHPVTVLGAQCVRKSYPRFWEEYQLLGGRYDRLLR